MSDMVTWIIIAMFFILPFFAVYIFTRRFGLSFIAGTVMFILLIAFFGALGSAGSYVISEVPPEELENAVFDEINEYRSGYNVQLLNRESRYDDMCAYNVKRILNGEGWKRDAEGKEIPIPEPDIDVIVEKYYKKSVSTCGFIQYPYGSVDELAETITQQIIRDTEKKTDRWARLSDRDWRFISMDIQYRDGILAWTFILFTPVATS